MHDSGKNISQFVANEIESCFSKPSSSANEARLLIFVIVKFVALVKIQVFLKNHEISKPFKENACKSMNLCYKFSRLRKNSDFKPQHILF